MRVYRSWISWIFAAVWGIAHGFHRFNGFFGGGKFYRSQISQIFGGGGKV